MNKMHSQLNWQTADELRRPINNSNKFWFWLIHNIKKLAMVRHPAFPIKKNCILSLAFASYYTWTIPLKFCVFRWSDVLHKYQTHDLKKSTSVHIDVDVME